MGARARAYIRLKEEVPRLYRVPQTKLLFIPRGKETSCAASKSTLGSGTV